MDSLFHKIGVVAVGVFGTMITFAIDNSDTMFEMARWVPITLSSVYVVWRWREDVKKKKK
ncbi:hypothetical protein [Flagellimonas sp.]|uniref:hypothetical protein n=1 Tax=Flagellimonas sp. TaxID=2058762 RepID=UPI003BA93FD2